jgi:peptide chain release factor 3
VTFPTIPSFSPEHFAVARTTDISRSKQFRSGIHQLDEEGVVQVLRDPEFGEQAPVLAAVGALQFEVAKHRLESEFGAPVELTSTRYQLARRTDEASRPELRAMQGVDVLTRSDGTLLALFESPYWLERLEKEHPELTLERLVAEGELRQ